jgi:hypothetical protein
MKFLTKKYILLFNSIALSILLFACSAISKSLEFLTVTVHNSAKLNKVSETIEIPWQQVLKIKNLNGSEVMVKNFDDGLEIPSQIIYNGEKSPQKLIFQTNITANSIQKFTIVKGKPAKYPTKTYGRQVPERFDDFAWENDKVAFRMYGEALEGKAGMAKGIDFWAKRTSDLVINKWYKSGNYHKDNGEGVDAYHVGITLGAGNAEPIIGEDIIYPINYSSYQILDQGPIRITFKLIFKPFLVNGNEVLETKIISLDAGSQLNKIINNYQAKEALEIAAGVTKHKNDGISKIDRENNFVAYWDGADGGIGNGLMGVAVLYPTNTTKNFKETKQHLLITTKLSKDNTFSYYQGGGWSKSGNYNTEKDWFDYLANFNQNLKNPLLVTIN